MTINLKDFSAQLDAFEASVKEAHAEQLRRVSLDLLTRLVERSPVKSGRFKGNWMVSSSRPALVASDRVDPDGRATIARRAAALRNVKPFDTVCITNATPYAAEVEEGSSTQAPAGIVQTAVADILGEHR
ncbi:MAG: HK97 gp10 family phage protein [Pseudomonadota bacterium]